MVHEMVDGEQRERDRREWCQQNKQGKVWTVRREVESQDHERGGPQTENV